MTGHVLATLFAAISLVESGGCATAINYQSQAYGIVQVRQVCLTDVNQVRGTDLRLEQMVDPEQARFVFEAYMQFHGKRWEQKHGRRVTPEILARIWYGGPSGWARPAAVRYGRKVGELLAGGP